MKIRWKLFLLLFVLTAGAAAVVLVVAERQLRAWVRGEAGREFAGQVSGLLESRQKRLEQLRKTCDAIAGHKFLQAEFRGTASRELREAFVRESMQAMGSQGAGGRNRPGTGGGAKRALPGATNRQPQAPDGRTIPGAPGRAGMRPGPEGSPRAAGVLSQFMPPMGVITLDGEVRHFGRAIADRSRERRERTTARLKELSRRPSQEVAYVITADDDSLRGGAVQEVVVTPVKDEAGEVLGWFFLGIDAEMRVERLFQQTQELTGREARTGLVVDGTWFVRGVDDELAAVMDSELPGEFWRSGEPATVTAGEEHFLVIAHDLNPDSPLGKGYQVSVFPLGDLIAAVGRLRTTVGLIGGSVVLLAALSSFVVSKRMTRPIEALVAGTERIRQGDLETEVSVRSKDEFGVLGKAFNAMTKDLALKERYHEVLGKVSDPAVARQLMEGQLELGGRICEAAVLFCDIRGFTAMTEGMDPAEVIALLNEHMTAMTKVVYEHGGVVDKFVGDLVMAVFGVPLQGDHDAERAADCALAMVAERRRLDAESGRPVQIGVGVAFGEVVAGCMGSADRLNYTVLGDRVNLAARLCSAAAPGEVLGDAPMAEAARGRHEVAERDAISLKGFSGPVPVFALGAAGP